MSNDSLITIAIVGAGFSGTATAIHLIRRSIGRNLRVILFERSNEFGRGVAYAQSAYPHLLNVPASRMSLDPADPEDFLRFAKRENPQASGEDFLPRSVFGDYLQHLLEIEALPTTSSSQVEFVFGEVVDIFPNDELLQCWLTLADGRRFVAHRVVLALGAPLPQLPPGIRCSDGITGVKSDPWQPGEIAARDSLLVIGTGLTMIDCVTAALDRNPDIIIHAISRHGLLPPSQTAFKPDALPEDDGRLTSAAGSINRLMAAARDLGREAERHGGDWREAVTLLRRQIPSLWSSLSRADRSRFMRHARAYWDVHRHRAPAETLQKIRQAQASGRLFVYAGKLRSLDSVADGVRATWIERGSEELRHLQVAEVINCSGPNYDVNSSDDRLWLALIASGAAIQDDLRLGIRTGQFGALIAVNGTTSQMLHYIGPLLRADHWEATAVGELRVHAKELASHLLEAP